MNTPVFGFDIDDVVFYTFKELSRTAKDLLNVDIIEPSSFGSGCTTNGLLTDSQWRCVVDAALIDYDKFEPIPNAIHFLEKYQEITGNKIVFITSRNPVRKPEIGEATENLMKKYIPHLNYEINYSRSGEQPKVDIARRHGVNVFVEDRLKYAKEVERSGILVLMPLRTWNKRYLTEICGCNNIIPVTGWDDIDLVFHTLLWKSKQY